MMAGGSASHESLFSIWLAKRVTPTQLSDIYTVIADINSYCLSKKLLSRPLFETDDFATLKKVRETIEQNKLFAFRYRKQKRTMILAIQHYCRYIKEIREEGLKPLPAPSKATPAEPSTHPTNSVKPLPVTEAFAKPEPAEKQSVEAKPIQAESKAEKTEQPASKAKEAKPKASKSNALMRYLSLNHIAYLDNRAINGTFWIIGGNELRDFVRKCSVLGIHFRYKEHYEISTGYIKGWWTRDDIDHPSKPTPTLPYKANAVPTQPSEATKEPAPAKPMELPKPQPAEKPMPRPVEVPKASATVVLSPELEELLKEEEFVPFKQALAKAKICTIEQLKALRLWAFMNQNNLYSISMRQSMLDRIRLKLTPEQPKPPELLFELHCGEDSYSADTLAKAFLKFCADFARKYPLYYRTQLDKTVGGDAGVKLAREAVRKDDLQMDNPICYIPAELTKDAVLAAATYLVRRCISASMPVSVKLPEVASKEQEPAPNKEQEPTPSKEHMPTPSKAQEPTPSEEQEPTSSKEQEPTPSKEQRLDLANIPSMAFTKPTSCFYKGKAVPCTAWDKIYFELTRMLYQDHRSLFKSDVYLEGSGRPYIGSNALMTYPRQIDGDVYLECCLGARDTVLRISRMLRYCGVPLQDVSITYTRQDKEKTAGENKPQQPAEPTTPPKPDASAVDPKLCGRAERLVQRAGLNGVSFEKIYNALGQTQAVTGNVIDACKRIVLVQGKYYHEEAFVDWEDGARKLHQILEKLMQRNNGYVSYTQLYEYARAEMNMFLNDNDMNSDLAVYDLAQHLFEKNSFEGEHYTFSFKTHISKGEQTIGSIRDVIFKFADEQGGFFSESELAEHMTKLGLKPSNLRQHMRIGKEASFFIYQSGTILCAKHMGIDDAWKDSVRRALQRLIKDVGDHIVLRQIQGVWYDNLPELPGRRAWTPLLLQYVLLFYGEEVGARTIAAMESQTYDTLHAMLTSYDSPLVNFGDAVISLLVDGEIEQRSFTAEELRQLLLESGMIQGGELLSSLHKALDNDARFVWDMQGENVTIRL